MHRSLLRSTPGSQSTPHLPTNIVDFRGLDSSIILISRGGILMSIGNLEEGLGQAMLVGTMLVGRLGVPASRPPPFRGPLIVSLYIYVHVVEDEAIETNIYIVV